MSALRHAVMTAIIALLSLSLAKAQIVVNSLDDDGGPGDCELREAITNANNDNQAGSTDCAAGSGVDLIDLTGLGGTIVLNGTPLAVYTDLSIEGPGPNSLSVDGDGQSRVLAVLATADVSISGLAITGGAEGTGVGGGILNRGKLTLANVRVHGNQALRGGGVANEGWIPPADPDNGTLNITNSEISGNTSTQSGGGISNDSLGALSLERSIVSGNHGLVGGGIHSIHRVTIANSTLSGNTATDHGGGINVDLHAAPVKAALLRHVTVTGNEAGGAGGGLWIKVDPGVDTAWVSLTSTLIAGNSSGAPASPDVSGHVQATSSFNLLGDNTGSTGLVDGVDGNQVGTVGSPIDPKLFELANNGVGTKTHLPKPDSPVIDNGTCNVSIFDQRGVIRAQDLDDGTYPDADDGCDIGAVEITEDELEIGVDFAGTVLLEGPYVGPFMSTELNATLPLTQPFGNAVYAGTPLAYDGPETVDSVPAGVVDWLLLSLRTAPTADSEVPGSVQPAFLTEDGSIVGLDGATFQFTEVQPMSYWLVVRHRNHMAVMTSEPIVGFQSGSGAWDFTSGAAYNFGGTPMKLVEEEGTYAMFAADGSADGQATAPDFNLWIAATTAGATGYEPSDYNLDGQVTAPDFNLWIANTTAGAASQVPE